MLDEGHVLDHFSCLTHRIALITHPSPPITYHVSRITYHVSRITHHGVSRVTHTHPWSQVLYSGGMRSDSDFNAVFEFEAELTLKAFMSQRRRWINGTVAGCIYALSQTPAIIASKEHTSLFKVANVSLLALQTLGFFLMFLSPALFGFLFGSAAGMIGTHIFGEVGGLAARATTNAIYGVLYVLFVAAHVKRTGSNDCVLQPTLTKTVLIFNALLAATVFAAIILNLVLEGAWFILVVYASVPGLPILCACLGADWEGAWLMARAFPVFALASPSFVGTLSAYSAARIADLTWGNRPAATARESNVRRDSLGRDNVPYRAQMDADKLQLARWLKKQVGVMKVLNCVLVLTNLALMVGFYWLVDGISFLPLISPSWVLLEGGGVTFFAGAVELYLLFSLAWLLQQLIGLVGCGEGWLRVGCGKGWLRVGCGEGWLRVGWARVG